MLVQRGTPHARAFECTCALHLTRAALSLTRAALSAHSRMKVVIDSIGRARQRVFEAALVFVSVQSVFAVVGMTLFMGVLASCSDPTVTSEAACVDPPSPPAPP